MNWFLGVGIGYGIVSMFFDAIKILKLPYKRFFDYFWITVLLFYAVATTFSYLYVMFP